MAAGADPYLRDRKYDMTALDVARAEDASPEYIVLLVRAMRRLSQAASLDEAGVRRMRKVAEMAANAE